MTNKPDDNMAHSLVPELRQQEERLLAELEQARAEVAQAKAEAESATELRLAEGRRTFPELVDKIRKQGEKELQKDMQAKQSSGQEDIAQLEKQAESNLTAAVKHILSLVMPGAQA